MTAGATAAPGLDVLLELVRESRGFDFTGYKRASIQRRVAKRMEEVGIERYEDYTDYLQTNPEEFARLFDTLLINVTSFFRDAPTWEYLAVELIPQLVAGRAPDAPMRLWSAGCATGEEAYTLAMVLVRVLGEEAFLERVKIYATDVDQSALDVARLGVYRPRQIEDVPREALERCFERIDQRYVFRKDLRRCVIFGRNDLVRDAPISRIDLLACRNTLMYFTAESQARILRRFHFALNDQGALLVGRSETLVTHTDQFTPVDLKRRAFRKVIRPAARDRLRGLPGGDSSDRAAPGDDGGLLEAAFAHGPARVVLDRDGVLMMASAAARKLFDLGADDLGRPIQDLELSYRPIELRSHLDQVMSTMRKIEIRGVRWPTAGKSRVLDLVLTPVFGNGAFLGTSIAYDDVTEADRLRQQVAVAQRELEVTYEELQSTVEELETTNEELQSTVEELETTNEELQSTNAEVETMNEELQSTNEELETMNQELHRRTLELGDVNSFLEKVLSTIGLAVAVLDGDQRVQIWNRQARDLWGLAIDEVAEQHLTELEFGLPVERLRPTLRAVLDGSDRESVLLDSVNRRGKPFTCRVTLLPLGNAGRRPGLIMMMEPVEG